MHNIYRSPFELRYSSKEMKYIFSQEYKFITWRKLWIALARAQMKLGIDISQAQIKELENNVENINYEVAQDRERLVKHDVMAHVFAFGQQCPNAKGIIHLGATSCYVVDNTDLIIMKKALEVVKRKLINVINNLATFAMEYKDMPCLAYTHLQPAQLTTVGKRASIWLNEFLMDFKELEFRLDNIDFLGSKGTTGTQASFMELFNNDSVKVKKLEEMIANEMGFSKVMPVSGQTYSRKLDSYILNTLSGIAQSASKFSTDLRLLQGFKELEEPFDKSQIGSSAMPYKRNPMRSERITSIARLVIINCLNPAFTSSVQWFERTLDDSANKRICVSESFLAIDSILDLLINITDGIVVYPKVVNQRMMNELPFMVTENIMMSAVKKGGDRQLIHEKLRLHSLEAAKKVKEFGEENDLVCRIANDKDFNLTLDELNKILVPLNFVGRAPEQVTEFINNDVRPTLEKYKNMLGEKSEFLI